MIYPCEGCGTPIDEQAEHLYGDCGFCDDCDRDLRRQLRRLEEEEGE